MPPGPARAWRRPGAQPQLDLRAAERGGIDLQPAARGLSDAARDVEPEPGRARAAVAAPQGGIRVGDAWPRVGDEDEDDVLASVQRDREPGALRGVLDDVADQRVRGGREIGAR